MKNKDLVEIGLGILLGLILSFIAYKVGYHNGEMDSLEWVLTNKALIN